MLSRNLTHSNFSLPVGCSSLYPYGFNGKRKDDDVKGSGNGYDYGMRVYDPRLGKFLSVDPIGKDFPWYSPYHYAGNSPVVNVDLDGLEDVSIHKNKDKTTTMLVSYNAVDIKGVLAKQIPEKRIKYAMDGSSEKKETPQFEGAGKNSEEKLFNQLKDRITNQIDKTNKEGKGQSESHSSGIIPAPPMPVKPKLNVDAGADAPKEEPKTVKYAIFELQVEKGYLKELNSKGKDYILKYIEDNREVIKNAGYDEVRFKGLVVKDKISGSAPAYSGDKTLNEGDVGAKPVITETGTEVKK